MSFVQFDKNLTKPYGCDSIGRLRSVIVHTPGKELELINENNCERWLFKDAPNAARFRDEHLRYQLLLQMHGVKIYELSDYVFDHRRLIDFLPNMTYLHDTAVVSSKGAIISNMASQVRKKEKNVVREAFDNLGIPVLVQFDDERDAFEGCQLISPENVIVFCTDRFKYASVYKFIRMALGHFDEIVFVNVPKERGFTHPDTVFNRISPNLAVAYMPALRETFLFRKGTVRKVDFVQYMKHMGIEIVSVSDSEQRRNGCSFVPLESGVIIHDDQALDKYTRKYLSGKGVQFIFHHGRYLKAGGGSIRSHTLSLHRKSDKQNVW